MISKRARFINFILRRLKIQERLADFDTGMKFLARDRKNGPARPGRWFRKHSVISETRVQNQKIYEIELRQNSSKHHIFYLHGGGYAFNITFVHWMFLKHLIRKTGASATVPLYPLAPEHDWSESYPFVIAAFEKAAAKYGAENITVMGDSAGGGYSLGLAQMLRDRGKSLPGKIILLSPWLDAAACDPGQPDLEKHDVLLSVQGTQTAGQFWAGEGNDPKSFPASPLYASIENLPPIAVFSGSHDLLFADALRLKAIADERAITLPLHIGEEMQHVWMLMPIREAKAAKAEVVAFISK